MQDLVIGILGVIGLLIGIKVFDNFNVSRGQKKLDAKVKENDKKVAGIEGEQHQEDRETQRRVDEITEEQNEHLRKMATTAYQSLDSSGLTRADFFILKDGRMVINEVNTMPGFTPFSMFPLLWKHTGVEYPQLIEKLIELAIERYEEKQKIIHTF